MQTSEKEKIKWRQLRRQMLTRLAPRSNSRASDLSGKRLDDRLSHRVGILIEWEVAAVEIVHRRPPAEPVLRLQGPPA